MYIKKIKLQNYRNYDELDVELVNGVNIIYGENATGKTNFLNLYIYHQLQNLIKIQKIKK